jgi:hypothetical protein
VSEILTRNAFQVEERNSWRNERGQFQKGYSGGGRPKGSRNKLTETFIADFLTTWEEGGIAALRKCRDADPATYCRIAASLLPKQAEIDVNIGLEHLTTVAEVIEYAREELGDKAAELLAATLTEPDVIEHEASIDDGTTG